MRPLITAVATLLLLVRFSPAIEPGAIPSVVSFGGFPLDQARTHIYANAGTPAGKAELISPFPDDFPPHLVVGLETGKEADGGGRFLILSRNYLRIYNIREVKTAPYKTIQSNLNLLEAILQKRPQKPSNAPRIGTDSSHELPAYPPRNAGHLIESKLSYIDAPWGSGILYITQFVQGMGETPNNQQLVLLFQGISKRKNRFVSADFQITHPSVPAGTDEPSFDWRKPEEKDAAEAFCEKIERGLDRAADESFTPSLRSIREWLMTLKVDD